MTAQPDKPVMTGEIALLFCQACCWAYQVWVTHKCLFDQNDKKADTIGKAIAFTNRLSTITQEYSLQQIAKLHDPAKQRGGLNVSVDFVVKFGDWGDKDAEIKEIEARLLELWEHLKSARNKVLAHNDLEASSYTLIDAGLPRRFNADSKARTLLTGMLRSSDPNRPRIGVCRDASAVSSVTGRP